MSIQQLVPSRDEAIEAIEKFANCRCPSLGRIFKSLRNTEASGIAVQSSGHLMWYGEQDYGESIDWNEIWGDDRVRWDFDNDNLYGQEHKTIITLFFYLKSNNLL